MVYPIVKYGQQVLESKAETVTEFDTPELNKLLEDMFESMYAAKGVGLAAPQIGIGRRIAVIDTSTGEDPSAKLVMINPEIIGREGTQTSEEGCLSIPDFVEIVTRPERVKLRYLDRDGIEPDMWGEGLMARAMCHEIDHLNGTLFVDHLRGFKKDRILKKISKLARSGMWG